MAEGDGEALAAAYERHRDFVFQIAFSLTGRREDALDGTQETFLALLRQSSSLDPRRGLLTTWLYRVARNRALYPARKRRRSDAGLRDPATGGPRRRGSRALGSLAPR